MSSRPCFLKASAWPTAVGIPSPTIPLQPNAGSLRRGACGRPCRGPGRSPCPKISAAILFMSTPCASAWWWGRWVAVTASVGRRCAQTPAATGSWPADRCISPGHRPGGDVEGGRLALHVDLDQGLLEDAASHHLPVHLAKHGVVGHHVPPTVVGGHVVWGRSVVPPACARRTAAASSTRGPSAARRTSAVSPARSTISRSPSRASVPGPRIVTGAPTADGPHVAHAQGRQPARAERGQDRAPRAAEAQVDPGCGAAGRRRHARHAGEARHGGIGVHDDGLPQPLGVPDRVGADPLVAHQGHVHQGDLLRAPGDRDAPSRCAPDVGGERVHIRGVERGGESGRGRIDALGEGVVGAARERDHHRVGPARRHRPIGAVAPVRHDAGRSGLGEGGGRAPGAGGVAGLRRERRAGVDRDRLRQPGQHRQRPLDHPRRLGEVVHLDARHPGEPGQHAGHGVDPLVHVDGARERREAAHVLRRAGVGHQPDDRPGRQRPARHPSPTGRMDASTPADDPSPP